jgi:hypothetical protein
MNQLSITFIRKSGRRSYRTGIQRDHITSSRLRKRPPLTDLMIPFRTLCASSRRDGQSYSAHKEITPLSHSRHPDDQNRSSAEYARMDIDTKGTTSRIIYQRNKYDWLRESESTRVLHLTICEHQDCGLQKRSVFWVHFIEQCHRRCKGRTNMMTLVWVQIHTFRCFRRPVTL